MSHRVDARGGPRCDVGLGALLRSLGYRALGGVSRAGIRVGLHPRGLRVLAYHYVSSSSALREQLLWLQRHFHIVTLDQALEYQRTGPVGPGAALVTFDDGDPTVVDRAQPVLDSMGIKAVMFVCPRLVDTREPYWWQVVQAAAQQRVELSGQVVTSSDVGLLKSMPDGARREFVRRLRAVVEAAFPSALDCRQVSIDELVSWREAGHSIGNHTWDHPLLDQCDAADQTGQIEEAHSWLIDRGLMAEPVFAYPNGNRTVHADSVLRDLGYSAAMLFDHRVESGDDPLTISRLRVNVDDDMDVFVSKVSGLHPSLHALAGRR